MSSAAELLPTQMKRGPNRAQAFSRVSAQIPANEFGLPRFLYRPDLIPEDIETNPDKDEILESARIHITFREGYPTFTNSSPMWEQMPNEADEDFTLFQHYLRQLPALGYRSLKNLEDLPLASDLSANHLATLYAYNYWVIRCRAFDLFNVARQAKVREQRILNLADVQYLEAERVLEIIKTKSDTIFSNDKMEELDPKDAVKMMADLMKIQRGALGMEGGTMRRSNQAESVNASIEVTMREIAQKSGAVGADGKTINPNGSGEEQKPAMRMLLGDAATAALAQELIVRVEMKGRKDEKINLSYRDAHEHEHYMGDLENLENPKTLDITPTVSTTEQHLSSSDKGAVASADPVEFVEYPSDPQEDIEAAAGIDDIDREMLGR